MPKSAALFCLTMALPAGAWMAADPPQAEISNGLIQARLYLPDPERGYYRGTRFDWSGVISSLRYAGHEYYGQWFEKYDPRTHDAIQGPVEEFRPGDSSVGYDEAKSGGAFIRIGVGAVRKPDEPRYRIFNTYEIVDHGQWKIRKGRDRVEFTHTLAGPSGYAYVYRKTVRLEKGKPQLVLEHSLKNTGKKPIETSQYNHNFHMIDAQPTGPDFVVKFPFDVHADRGVQNFAETRNGEIVYLRELQRGQSFFTELKGYGDTAQDYDFRIENRKVGAGVRITSDQPLEKLVYWSIRTTLCPEPYIKIRVEPGRETRWRITYEYYVLPR